MQWLLFLHTAIYWDKLIYVPIPGYASNATWRRSHGDINAGYIYQRIYISGEHWEHTRREDAKRRSGIIVDRGRD